MHNEMIDFIRSKPKPSDIEALDFAKSVMIEKGLDDQFGPYKPNDLLSLSTARTALEANAIDLSECMALEMINYTLGN